MIVVKQISSLEKIRVRDRLNCPEIRHPDVCLFLDLTPEQSLSRISKGRMTQEIYENKQKLEQVREKFYSVFDRLGDEDRIIIIDANRPAEELAEEIYDIVKVLGVTNEEKD